MVRFNDEGEFLGELARELPRVVRVTVMHERDPVAHPIIHFWKVAGFRNFDNEIVELREHCGQAFTGMGDSEVIAKVNASINTLTLRIRDVRPDVEVRCGMYLEDRRHERQ